MSRVLRSDTLCKLLLEVVIVGYQYGSSLSAVAVILLYSDGRRTEAYLSATRASTRLYSWLQPKVAHARYTRHGRRHDLLLLE